MRYIDKLIVDCQTAKTALPRREFVLENLSQLTGIQQAIYIIEDLTGNPKKTFSDFSSYKKGQKERRCAKLNSPSSTMYVGSSTTGVTKRIEQHLGDGYKGTYSLHLNHWFDINMLKITIKEYSQPREVLQIIEDDLSDHLKPAFGKKGGNNK